MLKTPKLLTILVGLAAVSTGAAAADTRTALVIGNENYTTLERADGGAAAQQTQRRLEQAGFTVVRANDLRSDQIERALSAYTDVTGGTEQQFILLTGRFVTSGSTTWFLPVDVPVPTLANLPQNAIPVSLILDLAAQVPGESVVGLGEVGSNRRQRPETGVIDGLGNLRVPDGVTVITGPAARLSDFMAQSVLTNGTVIDRAVKREGRGLTALGYLPADESFLPRQSRPQVPPRPAPSRGNDSADAERAYWTAVNEIGTASAFQAYLDRYPRGDFARSARDALKRLDEAPTRKASDVEKALDLNRGAKRQIQRNLTILGYDTRGIDGIFGRGTRNAIGNWQKANNFDVNGYLDRPQLAALTAQADKRASEVRAEERQAQEEERRKDGAYWRQTGRGTSESGIRDYLKRYPEGRFADLAKSRLEELRRSQRANTEARERSDWDNAVSVGTIQAYRDYLRSYPDGIFHDEATNRIARLQDQAQKQNRNDARAESARAEEQQLALAPVTFLLVEKRLASLGLDPGPADGRMTEQTRRAIREYQRTRNLDVTGYLSRQTVVRIIAEAVQ
ncbi:peptidoglycan-binding protein [Brevirhabdus sp.]|uniref:peptidoglycan-binding protein n=1 Tax=Brevirhabdus sp. TaxID=2004514 RepID=UPI004058A066